MKWISVKDRLPEEDQEILAYDEINGILQCKYEFITPSSWIRTDNKNNRNVFVLPSRDDDFDEELINVTYWMPLPEEPKE